MATGPAQSAADYPPQGLDGEAAYPPQQGFDGQAAPQAGVTQPVAQPNAVGTVVPNSQAVAQQSLQINPTVTSAAGASTKAPWVVYVIHGLQSNSNTWVAKNGFAWLDHLSQYLTTNHGEACTVEYIGWNTTPLGTVTNIASGVDAARQLSQQILRKWEGFEPRQYMRNPSEKAKVIFIGHSMGGILARAILGFMNEDPNKYKSFLDAVQGVCLLASPSGGSKLADIGVPLLGLVKAFVGVVLHLPATAEVSINDSHVRSLIPNSADLTRIEKSFNAFCIAYQTSTRKKLKVSALRETAGEVLGIMVVSEKSADIPASTLPLVDGFQDNLQGLSHTGVTNYTSMQDPNLQKILRQFLRFQGVQAPGAATSIPSRIPPGAGLGPAIPPTRTPPGGMPAGGSTHGSTSAPTAPGPSGQPRFPASVPGRPRIGGIFGSRR